MSEVRVGRSLPLPPGIEGDAAFSEDGRFRWWLLRWWDNERPTLVTIATNPSSAGSDRDDSTIRILENLAIRQGFGRLVMLNAYALVSTDFAAVRANYAAAVGEWNDARIRFVLDSHAARPGTTVLAAWGAIEASRHGYLAAELARHGYPVMCLGRTGAQYPRHPLRTQTRQWYPYSSSSEPPIVP